MPRLTDDDIHGLVYLVEDSKPNAGEQQAEQSLHELIVYHGIDEEFLNDNIYAWPPGNAKHIAMTNGCKLRFKSMKQLSDKSHRKWIRVNGHLVSDNGCSIGTVVIGDNPEKLKEVCETIHRKYGVTHKEDRNPYGCHPKC